MTASSEPLVSKGDEISLEGRLELDGISKQTPRTKTSKPTEYKLEIVWRNVFLIGLIHIIALYGYFLFFTLSWKSWSSITIITMYSLANGFGITAGAHRLWAHKCYKAKLPLEIFLAVMQTVACQNSIYEWCRDHRVHHKYTETDADPHNARRGFFFSHVGWLLTRKHPDVRTKGNNVDMSDLEANPVVMFQKKYFIPLTAFLGFILPIWLHYIVGEDYITSVCFTMARYVLGLNFTWLVNSAAHMWGTKPYDKTINPVESTMVAILAFGEGWHNYHHVFPWDYKTAELGEYRRNISTAFIDFFSWIGLAYDLKTVPKNIVLSRVARTGDGSHTQVSSSPWGWDDPDIPSDSIEVTEILCKLNPKAD